MLDGLVITVPGDTRLALDYLNGRGERHQLDVFVRRLRPFRRGDRVFVYVDAIDRAASGGARLKTFLAHRILGMIDGDTGEVFEELAAMLARLFRDTGHPPPDAAAMHKRMPGPGLDMTDDGFVAGWAFGVSRSFWEALDILSGPLDPRVRSARGMVTHGHPRVFAFRPGDTMHAPPGPSERWDVQRARLTHTVQVLDGTADGIAANGDIVPGLISYRIVDHRTGAAEIRETSQAQFVELLKNGV